MSSIYSRLAVSLFAVVVTLPTAESSATNSSDATVYDYRLLATNKTSTMEKELNEAAGAGYRFRDVMGGETSFGGSEVVVVMSKDVSAAAERLFHYKLLATNKTSTMQKEIQEAGDAGYEAVGQTIFSTTFGGDEVVLIMERNEQNPVGKYEYKLLATNKTSTMQKELLEAGEAGFELVGLTVSQTSFGGEEIVSVMRRPRPE
jgi:hypothetical protein